MVTANGNYLTKHSAGLYSTEPTKGAWKREDPKKFQAELDARARSARSKPSPRAPARSRPTASPTARTRPSAAISWAASTALGRPLRRHVAGRSRAVVADMLTHEQLGRKVYRQPGGLVATSSTPSEEALSEETMPNVLNAAQTRRVQRKGFHLRPRAVCPRRGQAADARHGGGPGRARQHPRSARWRGPLDAHRPLESRRRQRLWARRALRIAWSTPRPRCWAAPVYHYQSKLTAKEPEVGGAWEWHQDYGYWYYNGCLRPDMLSVMIALDRTDRENGCLQIATGSHQLGRIDHTPLSPTQNEVDPKRMPHILEQCPIEYCELGSRRCADLPLQRHPPLRRQPLGQPALDTADLLQPGRQRHHHQERRPLLRAARPGRRRSDAPRRPALRPRRRPGTLRQPALRAGPAQSVIAGPGGRMLDVRQSRCVRHRRRRGDGREGAIRN